MAQIAINVSRLNIGYFQFERDDLMLACIIFLMKAADFFNKSLSRLSCRFTAFKA